MLAHCLGLERGVKLACDIILSTLNLAPCFSRPPRAAPPSRTGRQSGLVDRPPTVQAGLSRPLRAHP